ncbi:MAG: PAS domain S-box protein, partial [Candidatus Zixiibacteriota bacterium]
LKETLVYNQRNQEINRGKKLSVKQISNNVTSRGRKPIEKSELERDGLHAALDSISSLVVIEDGNYNIQFMNKSVREVFGDRKGEKCYQKFMGREEPCPVCPIEEILKKGKKEFVYYLESFGKTYESHASRFKNPDGTSSIIEVLTDITERKKAEEALKESEERFRNFFENADDAIFIIDKETAQLLDANKRAEQLTGRSKQEIIGIQYYELYPRDKAEHHKEEFIQSVQKKQPVDFEAEILRKDGTTVPVLISANFAKFRGRVVIQSIFRDISGYKKAEEKITEERNKLATILANIGEGVNIVRSDYKVKYQNKFLLDRFGDLIGNKCYRGFTDAQNPCKGCPMKNIIENNSAQSIERKGKDGRYYELTLAPLKNPDQSVDALEVVRDITEKKKVQEKIAFLAGIVDHASESVIATDQNVNIIYVNPAT